MEFDAAGIGTQFPALRYLSFPLQVFECEESRSDTSISSTQIEIKHHNSVANPEAIEREKVIVINR